MLKKILFWIVFLVMITSAFASWCYQESANVSTACGGLNTGIYGFNGTWQGGYSYRTIDENWSTNANADGFSTVNLFINYTKPSNALNTSLWQYKVEGRSVLTVNKTINSNCWLQSILQFKYVNDQNVGLSYFYCYNGTSWYSFGAGVGNAGDSSLYEEAMWWNMTEDMYNNTLSVNITFPLNESTTTNNISINATIISLNLDSVWMDNGTQNISLLNKSNLIWSNNFVYYSQNSTNALKNEVNISQTGVSTEVVFNSSGANFNGIISNINYSDYSINMSNNWSVFVKFKPNQYVTTGSNIQRILSISNYTISPSMFIIGLNNRSSIYNIELWARNNTLDNSINLNLSNYIINNEYSVVITYNGTTFNNYVNGRFVNNGNGAFINNASLTLKLGQTSNPTGNYFNGSILDVKIYNRALSASEIYILSANNVSINQTFSQGQQNIIIYVNNTISVINSSIVSFNVLINTNCTYSGSGNWLINCSNNCALNLTNLGRNNFTFYGNGYINGFVNVTNYTNGVIRDGCKARLKNIHGYSEP
jgi:hypothetical protein